jgi:hypothetical protein
MPTLYSIIECNLVLLIRRSKLLRNVLERYGLHLDVEIVRTHRREFRDALKERQIILKTLIERLKTLVS